MKAQRVLKGILVILIYQVLYLPAKLAGKFSNWFDRWDLETFGF
jgi:hypothetical protein